MRYIPVWMAMAVALIFATPSFAQDAASCVSMEQFQTELTKQDPTYKAIVLSGGPLEQFAANMDKLTGGGHGPMDGLVFLDPEGNKNEITIIAVFRDHCYIGNAEARTDIVKQALGTGI